MKRLFLVPFFVFVFLSGCKKVKKQTSITSLKLANGLEVIVKELPEAKVTGIHLLVKRRLCYENKPGESYITQRMIGKATENLSPEEISIRLERLGADLKTYDNPYLPFDNYYNSRDYAYVRMRVLAKNTRKALKLFAQIVKEPGFETEIFNSEKKKALLLLKEKEMSPGYVAEKNLFKLLFKGTCLEKPLEGYPEAISKITLADIKEYYQKAYRPENLILTIVSPLKVGTILPLLDSLFGSWKNKHLEVEVKRPIKPEKKKIVASLQSKKAYIYMARRIPSIKDSDAVALRVAAYVLSDRLANELREKQGLAYSLGAYTRFFKDFGGIFVIVMGTSSEKLEKAEKGIYEVINSMVANPPNREEIERAINSRWGRHLRYHQRSINQAFFLAYYEYIGAGYEYDESQIKSLRGVSPERLVRVFRRYITKDSLDVSLAGNVNRGDLVMLN